MTTVLEACVTTAVKLGVLLMFLWAASWAVSGQVSTNVGSGNPCDSPERRTTAYSLTARTVVVTAAPGKRTYVCSFSAVAAAAEIVNVVEGTGTTCQTGTVALAGSTTAANGMSFAANGGISANDLAGSALNADICVVPSTTNRVAGHMTWVQR